MKSLVLCAILISTIVCQPQFVDVFVDVAENTEHYRHILVDAEKSVNMRRNETSYPHRRLIAARYARHKSVMDTGVSLAGITVAQTNCTIPDRFEYRQNYENYNNCVVIDVSPLSHHDCDLICCVSGTAGNVRD